MPERFSVLQSGFISADNKNLVRPEDNGASGLEFDAYILNHPHSERGGEYFYHVGVDELYSKYCADQRVILDFDFREKYILAFYDALVLRSFMDWATLQNDQPHLSTLHTKFLLDTLSFVATGQREMQPESWDLLIDKSNNFDKSIGSKIDSSIFVARGMIPNNIVEFLQLWHYRPMGFADFVVTTGIIFARREGRKTVS